MGEQFTFKNVVINYPVLIQAKPTQLRKEPKFSMVTMIDQNDPAQMQQLQQFQAMIDQLRATFTSAIPLEIKPGKNDPRLFINASAPQDRRPHVFDRANNEMDIMQIGNEIYSGAICNVLVDLYYTTNYNRICLGLLGVQKLQDGPRLDNAPDPTTMFGPAQGGQQPQGQQFNPQQPQGQQFNPQQPQGQQFNPQQPQGQQSNQWGDKSGWGQPIDPEDMPF